MNKTKRDVILVGVLLVVCAFSAGYFLRGWVSPNATANRSENSEESKIIENTTSQERTNEEKLTLPPRAVLEGVDLLEVRYSKEKNTFVAKLEAHAFSGMEQLMAKDKINSVYATKVSAQIQKRESGEHKPYLLTTEQENLQVDFALGKPFEITFVNPHKDFPMDELYEFDLTLDFLPTEEKAMPDAYSYTVSLLRSSAEDRFIEESLRTKEDQSRQDHSSEDK